VEVVSPGHPSPFRAREGIVRLGRDATNEVVIDDPFVSRVHLEIKIFPSGVTLVDMDTKNGTHHLGARIRELPLKDEVTLRLGKQIDITVRVGDDAAKPAPIAPEAPRHRRDSFDLVGASPAMERLRAAVSRIAPSPLTVLIEGETGTGKEVIARALHAQSPRVAKPFVVFDCAAVSPSLIASELFGHRKGAFTGAVSDNDGAFRRADGGTIFLDEIGELPLELQPALLRALEAREVRPVGDTNYKHVDVRVVAATNRSLESEVAAGRFRQDLLFRLKVGVLKVPPLRQRPEDIAVLARHFARMLYRGKYRELLPESERDFREEGGASLPEWMRKIGFSREYSRGDTWITTITVLWPLAFTLLFIVGTVYAMTIGISQEAWVEFWKYWTWLVFFTGCVIVTWFTIGGFRDLKRMYAHLEKYRADARDDGAVEKHRDA
jgi:pSer/pThr/pTyr-binding forkhead associated (FHA) protein